jgi:hypothetical protein
VQGKVRNDEDLVSFEKRINKPIISKIKEDILNKPENKSLKDKMDALKKNKTTIV